MKLIEALETINRRRAATGPPCAVLLACGFSPLHLETFLAAHLQERFPDRPVRIVTGLHGDLAGTVEKGAAMELEAATVVVEWADLDARLGLRQLGGWGPARLPDIVASATTAAARLQAALECLAVSCPVALCGPTLPLPPAGHTAGWQAGPFELDLEALVAGLLAWAARQPGVRVVRRQRLDHSSAPNDRLDVKAELRAGFPYRPAHAETVAALLAALVENRVPKKGLITDLDDTLWAGLVGEAGAAGVSWDLGRGTHVHAIYQQLLAALADSGTLLGVASKNDPAAVEEAFRRDDLRLGRDRVHPVQAGWGAKSEAVRHILHAWNIAADAVVFVDDSPMELAEVEAAHPGITCLRFPREDADAAFALLERLRDLFGKPRVTEEDRLRLASLRDATAVDALAAGSAGFEEFLAGANALATLDFRMDPGDARPLELVNKTNQFTLNGRRFTDAQWRALLNRPGAFLLVVSYEDRFGPLGKIAVVAGRDAGTTLEIDAWVMSCRAFSRRIEHQVVRRLFERFGVSTIAFGYHKTDRNSPLQDFFASVLDASPAGEGVVLTRTEFEAACPPLFHETREVTHG